VSKLRLLAEVERQLCRVELQQLCLEHNVLGALAAWLRPGEDGSLPNLRVRSALLTLCSRLPVDTQQPDGREQLKRSGLGKVVMFYKLHDEVPDNRATAARMVDAWSRPIFSLSAVYKVRARARQTDIGMLRWRRVLSCARTFPSLRPHPRTWTARRRSRRRRWSTLPPLAAALPQLRRRLSWLTATRTHGRSRERRVRVALCATRARVALCATRACIWGGGEGMHARSCALTHCCLCSLATATTPPSLRLRGWTTSGGLNPGCGATRCTTRCCATPVTLPVQR
jgi:hypothetical protein